LNIGLIISKVNVAGSPAVDVQVTVIVPPEDRLLGVLSVRAETAMGRARARALSLANIFNR